MSPAFSTKYPGSRYLSDIDRNSGSYTGVTVEYEGSDGRKSEYEAISTTTTTTTVGDTPILNTIITGNIRGLNPSIHYSKIEYLTDLAKKSSSYIITLTESHLNSGISDYKINMNGWSIHRSDRVGRKGGGVITLVNNDLIV